MRLFWEETGLEQAFMQQIVSTVEEAYFADIWNRATKSINNTMADVLTHLQDNFGQFMPHKIPGRKYIVKKTIYHPRKSIATVFSAAEELLEFAKHHRNILYTGPSREYYVCGSSHDGQVQIGDSQMVLHDKSPEDVD